MGIGGVVDGGGGGRRHQRRCQGGCGQHSGRSEIDASEHIVAAQQAMEAAIRREGMTVARYNEILAAAQRNGVLAARIQELVDKAAAGK